MLSYEPYVFDNKLLQFDDMICVEQLKLVFDFKNKNLPIELLDLFKLNSDINSHITRNVSKGAIFIPQVKTTILELNFSGTQRQFYGIILLKLMKSTVPKLEVP